MKRLRPRARERLVTDPCRKIGLARLIVSDFSTAISSYDYSYANYFALCPRRAVAQVIDCDFQALRTGLPVQAASDIFPPSDGGDPVAVLRFGPWV